MQTATKNNTHIFPHLIETKLDERTAKEFKHPITWEVADVDDVVIYEGELDYTNERDRSALGQLAGWCYSNNYRLITFSSRID